MRLEKIRKLEKQVTELETKESSRIKPEQKPEDRCVRVAVDLLFPELLFANRKILNEIVDNGLNVVCLQESRLSRWRNKISRPGWKECRQP